MLLRDGRPVHLRPITPADGPALRQFHGTLSARSVYFRFFAAKPELTDQDVEYFTRVDYRDRVALVAVDRARIVGVGRFDALGDGSAEVAIIIRDDCQGLGLGSILLEHLAEAARERGITRFVAEVLPANTRMLATFREAGYVVSAHREEDVIAVSFDIEPTADSRAVTAAREHRAEARSVQRLLHPRSVAVVGASRHPGGLGHQILVDLVDAGFTGEVVAVHPEVDEIAGVPCVRSLVDVGHEIDLVVVVVRAEAVAAVIGEAGQIGAHGLVIVSGGFGEAGEAGLARQAEVVGIAHATGIRVVGPNALGLINTDPAVRLNASLVRRMPRAGRVGFFSQSGALGSAILDRLETKGLGISTFVSAGNRADVSGNDLLQYWQDDASTDLVLLYVESMGNARKFARIVHGLAQDKPVVMVRSGGAEHTHPLGHAVERTTLTQRGVDQILADCGLIVVDDIDELIDVGRVCVGQPLPSGPGVGVVGNSDALAVMAANAMGRTGLISANPAITFPRGVGAAEFERAVHAAMDDPAVGSVLAIYVPAVEGDADEEIRAALVSCRICAGEHPKPVVAVMPGAVLRPADAGLAVFADVEDAVRALAAVAWLARWREYDRTKDAARSTMTTRSTSWTPIGTSSRERWRAPRRSPCSPPRRHSPCAPALSNRSAAVSASWRIPCSGR